MCPRQADHDFNRQDSNEVQRRVIHGVMGMENTLRALQLSDGTPRTPFRELSSAPATSSTSCFNDALYISKNA